MSELTDRIAQEHQIVDQDRESGDLVCDCGMGCPAELEWAEHVAEVTEVAVRAEVIHLLNADAGASYCGEGVTLIESEGDTRPVCQACHRGAMKELRARLSDPAVTVNGFTAAEWQRIAQAKDEAIEAAVRAEVEAEHWNYRHGILEGDELVTRLMDTLAYYHCRSVNPKADHPSMGYHAMSEDQREFLRERQREAAEEIARMWAAGLTRPATVTPSREALRSLVEGAMLRAWTDEDEYATLPDALADALSVVLPGRSEAEVKAEALRWAAEHLSDGQRYEDIASINSWEAVTVCSGVLRSRADLIERGEG